MPVSSASLLAPAKGVHAPRENSRLITSLRRRTRHRNASVTQCQVGAHLDTSASISSQPGLIFGLGESGAWDEAGVGHPVVRYYLGDNEQRWFMWYTGRSSTCHNIDDIFPASGSIGIAVSSDGVNWSRGRGSVEGARGEDQSADVGRVLAPNEDSWWWHDTCHMHVSDVQIMSSDSVSSGGSGVYWCFYSGGNFEEGNIPPSMLSNSSSADLNSSPSTSVKREGVTLRPGLAMSQDGRNFARIEADHHTGALFDVGASGEWDALFIGAPQVVNSGTKDMRMYYHSYDESKQKYVVGLATSPDGFKWNKRGPVFDGGSPGSNDFDAKGAATRCVVRDIDTKKYFMFYEGIAEDGRRSIGVAVSDDGIKNWKRQPEPVLTNSQRSDDDQEERGESRWDSGSVGTPCAVSMAKGKWRLYYSGRKTATSGPWEGIGLALSDDDGQPGQLKFKRRSNE